MPICNLSPMFSSHEGFNLASTFNIHSI
jgi:hypothetical protein